MQARNLNITFTGIKNVGGEQNTYYVSKIKPDGSTVPNLNRSVDNYVISMELTDDYNGKDLTNFKREVLKSGIENGFHDFNPNFLHLNILKPNNKKHGEFCIFLNDSKVEIKDENLGLLSFLAAALKKVEKTPTEKLLLNKNFIDDSYEAAIMINTLCMNYPDGVPEREKLTPEDNLKIQEFYDKNNAKKICSNALNVITDEMLDYFA